MIRAVLALLVLTALPSTAAAQDVNYRFPGSDAHRTHYYITAYRDLTGSGGGLQDWGCGTKTYDGHRGTDMGVGGFPGMDAGRDVVAAADGVVSFVSDGVFDRCTSGSCAGGGGFGNYVRIDHADGKVTYYGHLKKFSITVSVGETVTCGQTLGQVGSSGNSTGPHLHFEPRLSGVSDDPFSGPCGGPLSWWVDQGDYMGLPLTACMDAPPQHPSLSLDTELVPIDGQAPDAYPEGDSEGIFDIETGQTVTARFYVSDADTAFKSPNVVVAVEALGGFVQIEDWQVLDNWPENACGGDFCPNDANDNPLNPAHDSPAETLEIHLNALSPGETKMLELTLAHVASTAGQPPHARVRMWVKDVDGSYAKDTFDAVPDNVDDSQTFNGGDLRQEIVLDTWDAPDDGGGDGDDGGSSDGGDDGDDDPAVDGGCAVGPRGAPAPGVLLLAALVLGCVLRRRRD